MSGYHYLRTAIVTSIIGLWPLAAPAAAGFHLQEASIADIQRAIVAKEITARDLVSLYLNRIATYNGQCVKGAVDATTGFVLGDIEPIEKAGKLGAIMTVNLRGKRSRTDTIDNDPAMPDALEQAAALDEEFARTGHLSGPLHGVVFAVKDEFDTFDMRSTSGAAADYANDRPPRDATVVARLRAAGAIILAKANMGEYAAGDRSTYGGTTCNPYDTSRSSGRSSGGSGSAVAANLVTCALAEETGPSARNPASNSNLVGIVATHSLLSRAGIIPASLTRDRAGILCRSVKDAATVLGALAGYDPRDAATAASVGQVPARPYQDNADEASLRGMRLGVVREFMKPHTKADEGSIAIAEAALRDLRKAGAELVDPGPDGALFADAIAEILPALDARLLAALLPGAASGTGAVEASLAMVGDAAKLPPDFSLRVIADYDPQIPGEGPLRDGALSARARRQEHPHVARPDRQIDLFQQCADRRRRAAAEMCGSSDLLVRTEHLTRKRDGSTVDRKTVRRRSRHRRLACADRTVLQMLVNKVMADNRLDALVYPTKTVPAPRLGEPVEPTNLKTVADKVGVTIEGEEYERTVERVIDLRASLTPRLSPNSGYPTIAVPAGFVQEVHDRAVVRGADGSKAAGDFLPAKAVELPVSMDFLGRAFSEPLLIRIAAGFEAATHHRRSPKDFGPLAGEP